MTQKQKSLIENLIDALPKEQKNVFQEIMYYLVKLGYIPQKQNVKDFILSFKHSTNGKVIAKIGIRNQKGFVSIKFFACTSVSEKYLDALHQDIDSRNGQYSTPLLPNPVNMITNKCGYCGSICTGGGLGYYYKCPDGEVIPRCGAYPIVIPDIDETDIDEMKKVILEQHNYFLSIA
ncbi:MAG: hypothetical protein VB111_04120 [Clostridiaceae bacterium]|nr:hypothetical protein [Clostridiaceae bacterium]